MMKNFKSFLVKLVAALALALVAVVATQKSGTSNVSNTQTVQATVKLSSIEKRAREWVAMHESGGSYTARNGACYGKYQLNISYLNGNLSAKNQERVANIYVYGRYGSWLNAKRFWLSHHWY